MKVAIIDLGTNTFHLLIAEQKKGKIKILYQTKIAVKLGENGITSGIISEKPFYKGVRVIKNFSKIISRYKIKQIVATGTAAFRNAGNKKEFIEAIYKQSGIRIKIISGLKEATLIYEGVRHALKMGIQKSLIMDIGGGSVEFIIANKNKIYWKQSFDLGGALLLEKFQPDDPITSIQLKKIKSFLTNTLTPLFAAAKRFKITTLIGSSGSFDTFAEMIAWKLYSPDVLKNRTSYVIKLSAYYDIYHQLLYSNTLQRTKMKGLIAMRVDMIVIASILLTFVIEKLQITSMKCSTYALKEGVMWRMLASKKI